VLTSHSAYALVFSLLLVGCGASTSPGPGDAAAVYCTLPNGGRCPAGTSCPAGDGCNTCGCPVGGGPAQCTLRGCVPDAGPVGCRSNADCANGLGCVFSTLTCDPAARGRCEPPTPCFRAETYCACTGETYEGCNADRPTVRVGPCGDAGTGP